MPKFDTPANLPQWVERIRQADLPILQQTSDALDALRADEDRVDAQTISAIVLEDPLMTVKVLAHLAAHRPKRVESDVLTVNSAVLLMGVPPFLRHFADQPTIERMLADWPQAIDGVRTVVERSYRAAKLALAYSTHRVDIEAEVLHEAALLHDFVELLVWCHAPALALRLTRRSAAEPGSSRKVLEREILGVELNDLEQALMTRWRLPALLTRATDDRMAASPRVRTVLLATRIARHSEGGWHHPALQQDFEGLGHLLGLTPEAAMRKTVELLGADLDEPIRA
ncbi:MAG: HDOD domain-containing protein [Burkholderiaceae bacterium]